jgi:acetyl esterase/lipase
VFGNASDLQQTQPITFAGAGDPPALLMVAGKDTLVAPRNAERLAQLLRRAGVPVEVRTYADVGHVGILTAFAKPFRGRASVLGDVVRFARRVTRDAQK